MAKRISQAELEAYLDESLPAAKMTAIEAELRQHPELIEQLSSINQRRDSGLHSVGEIWRRSRLSCPTREDLGGWLLGVLVSEHAEYIQFHIERIGCRLCEANLEDLRRQQAEAAETKLNRRSRYFETSAGYLRKKR